MQKLTAIVLTKNEAIHIRRCLESLRGIASEVYVVDSGSTDETINLAQSSGARTVYNEWKNYATQFNWALENLEIDSEWIFRIDADEFIDDILRVKIIDFLKNPKGEVNSVILKRQVVFLGRPIRWGFFYPLLTLRIWRTGCGTLEDRWMDEHVKVSSPKSITLSGNLIDQNENDLTWWTGKHNSYATREVYDIVSARYRKSSISLVDLDMAARVRRFLKVQVYLLIPSVSRPSLYFFYRFFMGLGFLDGKSGFFYHFLQGYWYRTLVEAKLHELQQRAKYLGISEYELLCNEGILKGQEGDRK